MARITVTKKAIEIALGTASNLLDAAVVLFKQYPSTEAAEIITKAGHAYQLADSLGVGDSEHALIMVNTALTDVSIAVEELIAGRTAAKAG
jgi:hypothetical protein